MRILWPLIILLAAFIVVLLPYTACTYDYFEDETNYIVYVPEVKGKTVGDCRVMVYNKAGELVGLKTATSSSKDPRILEGIFAFRLMPGDYKIYCYANTSDVTFDDVQSLETASLKLSGTETEGVYRQPSDVLFDIFERKVEHQGILHMDTAAVKRYTGRITVRLKNFPSDLSKLSRVDLRAEGVASVQHLKKDTLTARVTTGDVIKHTDTAESVLPQGGVYEFEHRYFPSVEGGLMVLSFVFIDSGGGVITSLPVPVAHPATNVPIRLYHGKRIIIEIDRYLVGAVHLVGWDEDIRNDGGVDAW